MTTTSLFEILGVQITATQDEIRIAYKRLAMTWHPDRHINGDLKRAEDKFKAIQSAYSILSDPDKRRNYELSQENHSNYSHDQSAYDPWEYWRHRASQQSYRSKPAPVTGEDVDADLVITIEQACSSSTVKATVKVPNECEDCGGCGISEDDTCPSCGGHGVKEGVRGLYYCRKCHGSGYISNPPCKKCKGTGRGFFKRKLAIVIPPEGVSDGDIIRLKGMGGPGENGGANGDIFLRVQIAPHDRYRREQLDLHVSEYIDFVTAILGGKIDVLTPWGKRVLEIPPMTRPTRILRIVEAGLYSTRSKRRGDLYVSPVLDLLPGMEDYPLSAESELVLRVMKRMNS